MPITSRYTTTQLGLAGSSNQNRSEPASIERTLNFYPELTGEGGIDTAIIHSWPNLEIQQALIPMINEPGFDRGMHKFQGDMYHVFGNKLFKFEAGVLDSPSINARLIPTEVGVIAGGGECGMEDNGDVMVITNGSTPYAWDNVTLSLLPITFNPVQVQFLNDRFIFDGDDVVSGTNNRRFYMSNVQSTTVDLANSAYPRSKPDQFIAPYVFNQIIYMRGAKTIEPWQSVASGLPPAIRVDGGILETIGVANGFGMANTDKAMYFISQRGLVYQVISTHAEPISSVGVAQSMKDYDLTAVSASLVVRYNQNFIIFTFNNNDATWVYSETTNSWFELSSGQQSGSGFPRYQQGRYSGSSFLDIFDRTYVADFKRNQLFSLSDDLQIIPDDAIKERILPVIAGDTFGKAGTLLEMSKLRISMECCTGLNMTSSLDNIDNPILMISFSTDGKNFGTEEWVPIGREGENKVIEISKVLQFRRLYIKLKISDRGEFHLYAASIDLRQAGY
jgi:hypothetical protein